MRHITSSQITPSTATVWMQELSPFLLRSAHSLAITITSPTFVHLSLPVPSSVGVLVRFKVIRRVRTRSWHQLKLSSLAFTTLSTCMFSRMRRWHWQKTHRCPHFAVVLQSSTQLPLLVGSLVPAESGQMAMGLSVPVRVSATESICPVLPLLLSLILALLSQWWRWQRQ